MLFQTLDNKEECVGLYLDGQILYPDVLPTSLTKTWDYSTYLSEHDVEYASLYCRGKSLAQVCPESLQQEWQEINKRMKAFLTSFHEAKVSLRENCFFELVPERFLLEYCHLKDKISQYVFKTYERPKDYEFLLGLAKLSDKIKYQQLNIDPGQMNLGSARAREFYKKVSAQKQYIEYDIFGTKTGRLTTTKSSFPILTMSREFRQILIHACLKITLLESRASRKYFLGCITQQQRTTV